MSTEIFDGNKIYALIGWLRGLTRRYAVIRLLGLRVRIPPGAWILVSLNVVYCTGRCIWDGPIPRPGESYRVCMCHWVWSSETKPLHLHWV